MQNRNETSKRIRWSRYVELIRLHILVNCMELRWRQPCSDPVAPCTRFRKGEDRRKKKREVLHLFRCYTHTHPAGAGSTLKGKRKKKADTRRADGQNQRRGGRGTDGPPKPTYTEKRTWPKTAHTPKPHDTLRRGTRGELGTKWGLVGDKQNQNK